MLKTGLLVLLGLLWSLRLSAIKAAGVAGIPVHVVVPIAALGIAAFYTIHGALMRDWPPFSRNLTGFYLLSGVMGFLAPFALETVVAPHLPVFVFVVIIATMPLVTLALSILTGNEAPRLRAVIAVCLGFSGAVAIFWDTAGASAGAQASVGWAAAAFGVPLLYAINTVFIASRWPAQVAPVHVAHAQAMIVAVAALLGSLASGALEDWRLVTLSPPAMGLIVLGEGLALLVYLRITRDYGATFVSFANYISMVLAAIIGVIWFGDQLTPRSFGAAAVIICAVAVYQRADARPGRRADAAASRKRPQN
jgi:drug/metabolite transporter (DMT)-like permease